MYKKIRQIIAIIVLIGFTSAFIWGGKTHFFPLNFLFNFLTKLQLEPALIRASQGITQGIIITVIFLGLTLLFGRFYCSLLCPLGILQDLAIKIKSTLNHHFHKKTTPRFSKNLSSFRIIIFLLTIISLIFTGSLIFYFLGPYTIYSRFSSGIIRPIIQSTLPNNHILSTEYSIITQILPIFLLIFFVTILAIFKGRLWCNTICPIGAILGLLSKFSLFKPVITPSQCLKCGKCLKSCKAHCIDLKKGTIDTSRCVMCGNCLSSCPQSGIHYKNTWNKNGILPHVPSLANKEKLGKKTINTTLKTLLKQTHLYFSPTKKIVKEKEKAELTGKPVCKLTTYSESRRAFLGTLGCGITTSLFPPSIFKSESYPLQANDLNHNIGPATTPPGSKNIKHFLNTCTGCGLCISTCPTHVLQPATLEYGIRGFIKPHLDFSKGACDFTCNQCSQICPEGALTPIDLIKKQHTQIGVVLYHPDRCLSMVKQTECLKCVNSCPSKALTITQKHIPFITDTPCRQCQHCIRICPQKAITLQRQENGEIKPFIDLKKCIACGRCARACRPGTIQTKRIKAPQLDSSQCLGCGACLQVCPGITPKNQKAFTLLARTTHLTISPPSKI